MEGKNSNSSSVHQIQVAPFVAKTYEMVSDPRTDGLIRWGRGNNSFLVLDPALFSQLLLPSYFKHSNFSSFVRQLNTYGFRKVDPDTWEFAHESFLRSQTHLLPLVTRRRKKEGGISVFDRKDGTAGGVEEEEDEMLLQEVGRLRREQQALEEELQSLSKRLQATERRPQQMISFLSKVAEDPDFLPRLIISKKEQQKLAGDKKRRLILSPPPPPPPLPPPPAFPAPRLTANGTFPSFDMGAIHPLEQRADLLSLRGEIPHPSASVADMTGYNNDGVAVVPAIPPVNPVGVNPGGSQFLFLPEFGISQTSWPSTAPTFPFSLTGRGFF